MGRAPDFIGLGAQRSGTSWIYACLYDHPQLCTPTKEIHFFSRDANWARGQAWYERHFAECEPETKAGEFSSSLTADRLIYALSTKQLTATGNVRFAVPTGVATGRSLVADLGVNTGTLTPAQIRSKEGTISGDRLDVDNVGRQAVLRGHVAGTFGATRLTSETATIIERDKKIVFRGNVRVTRPGRVLVADTVTFYYEENRLVAEGQTRILIQETP